MSEIVVWDLPFPFSWPYAILIGDQKLNFQLHKALQSNVSAALTSTKKGLPTTPRATGVLTGLLSKQSNEGL